MNMVHIHLVLQYMLMYVYKLYTYINIYCIVALDEYGPYSSSATIQYNYVNVVYNVHVHVLYMYICIVHIH